jgi:hypothetical protein
LPDSEEITGQLQILATNRRTLAVLIQQQAQFGALYAPPYLVLGIEEKRAAIERVKTTLRGLGAVVDDLPKPVIHRERPSRF